MKNTAAIFITLLLTVITCNAQSLQQKTDSIYRVRSYVINELFAFGFKVDKSKKRTTVLSNNNGPGDYFYQVAITVKRDRLSMQGYAFLDSKIRKVWTEKPFYGKDKLYELMYSGVQRSKGIIMPEIYLWSWDREPEEEENVSNVIK